MRISSHGPTYSGRIATYWQNVCHDDACRLYHFNSFMGSI